MSAIEGTVHFHQTTHPGKPDVKIWYDVLDRAKRTETEGFQNLTIALKTTYDAKGNVSTTTSPYKPSETILTTTNAYDTYNRLYQSSNALNTTTLSYAYATGNLTTTTSINTIPAQVTSKVTDAAGKTITATDDGGTLAYIYFSHGKLKDVKNGTTTLVACEYDDHVQQKKLTDINAGITGSEASNAYTNISEGFGILTGKNVTSLTNVFLGSVTVDSMNTNILTRPLNFKY